MICPHCGYEIPGMTVRPTPLQFLGPGIATVHPLTVNSGAMSPAIVPPVVSGGFQTIHLNWTIDANGNWIAQSPATPPVIDSTLEQTQQEEA